MVRHDAAFAGSHLTHGTAKIEMCNLSGSIATPASIAKFHIGLTGTTSTSTSNAAILVQAFGVARFQGVPIQSNTLTQKLTAKMSAARAAVDRAEQVLGQRKGKPSKAALKKALKNLKMYATILGSKKARREIPEATRSALGTPVSGLQSDVRALPTSSGA